eukprot:365450_1
MLILISISFLITHSYGENIIKYVTFNGIESNCKINGNECNIYQQNDVSKVVRTSTGKYQIFWKSSFPYNNYGLFVNSNINSGAYGFAQIGGNNDETSTFFGVDVDYALIDARKIGDKIKCCGIYADSDYISVVATTDFFGMSIAVFNGKDMKKYLSKNIGKITALTTGVGDYKVSFINPFPDNNYIIGLSSNFYGSNGAAAGIRGNNIAIDSLYYTIKTNQLQIETRRTTDINKGAITKYLSIICGYPQLENTKSYNVKWVTFNGANTEIYSNNSVSTIESLSSKKYRIHWTIPFQTDNYAVFGASNYWGTWGSQFTVSGVVSANFVEIQTATLDNIGRINPKSNYISIFAFEYTYTAFPTISPSNPPSNNPTLNPSLYPTISPSNYPSDNPTLNPSIYPTISPSNYPSDNPTVNLLDNVYESSNYIGIPKL